MKKVTILGGGTGTFVVLSAIKKEEIDLAAIVSMTDSGGSTGRLRDQLGVLPPGDLRQALVALSEAPMLWRKLFLYRFEQGDLQGHNFGNIFLSALEKVTDNYEDVIKTASYVLQTKGKVIPVTFETANLCVEYANGKTLKGEGKIDSNYLEKSRIVKAYLEPKVNAHSEAIKRIEESDYLIIGPGDLYATIISVLLPGGIREAILKSGAKIIFNMNLMTKSGQATSYKASDYITDLTVYMGRAPDTVVINTGEIPKSALEWYAEEGESPVQNDLKSASFKGRITEGDIVDKKQFVKSEADKYVDPRVRSILRHDPEKLSRVLKEIIFS